MIEQGILRIAATADLHITTNGHKPGGLTHEEIIGLFEHISNNSDAAVICGDITQNGLIEEAKKAAGIFKECKSPIYAVLGNHDHRDNKGSTLARVLYEEGGVNMLPGKVYRISNKTGSKSIGLVGVDGGSDGGFVEMDLSEKLFLNQFPGNNIEASFFLLRDALNRLTEEKNLVAMHFAPIAGTVIGESRRGRLIAGSPHYGKLFDRYAGVVSKVVHGHSHHGSQDGKTEGEIDVYNVAVHVLAGDKLLNNTALPSDLCRILKF